MPTNEEEIPRVYLDKVHFKGFKSIDDVNVDFQKGLNILIGKNGSGKSNFLELIDSSIRYKRDIKIDFRFAQLEFLSNNNHSFIFKIERKLQRAIDVVYDDFYDGVQFFDTVIIDGKIELEKGKGSTTRKGVKFKGRRILYSGIPRFMHTIGFQTVLPLYIKFGFQIGLGYIEQAGELTIETDDKYNFWSHSDSLNFIKLMFLNMYVEDILGDKSLSELNSNDVLKHLRIPDNIVDNLRLFTPVKGIRFNNNINLYFEGTKFIVDNVKLEFNVNDNWLPWSQLSDGTKRLFYIVSEITGTDGLVLLEEPELGVHPHQFHLLMNFLKEQSEHKQIIISTHAPKALDVLETDELDNILITYYDPEKGTQLKHLSDDQKEKAKLYLDEVGFFSDYWLHSDLEE